MGWALWAVIRPLTLGTLIDKTNWLGLSYKVFVGKYIGKFVTHCHELKLLAEAFEYGSVHHDELGTSALA